MENKLSPLLGVFNASLVNVIGYCWSSAEEHSDF
jgi:hypothetical protein